MLNILLLNIRLRIILSFLLVFDCYLSMRSNRTWFRFSLQCIQTTCLLHNRWTYRENSLFVVEWLPVTHGIDVHRSWHDIMHIVGIPTHFWHRYTDTEIISQRTDDRRSRVWDPATNTDWVIFVPTSSIHHGMCCTRQIFLSPSREGINAEVEMDNFMKSSYFPILTCQIVCVFRSPYHATHNL